MVDSLCSIRGLASPQEQLIVILEYLREEYDFVINLEDLEGLIQETLLEENFLLDDI